MFDNERKQDIINYITNILTDEIKYFCRNVKLVIKDRENLARECIKLQFYYDEDFNKIYLHYELDKKAKSFENVDKLYSNINRRIYNNFYKDKGIFIDVLNPAGKFKEDRQTITEHYEYILSPYTFSYWKCFDNMYRFIEDTARLISDHNVFFDSELTKERLDKEKNFFNSVLELNKKYNFQGENNEESVKNAFEEYKQLYLDFYNRKLNVINENEITYIYYDAYYKE